MLFYSKIQVRSICEKVAVDSVVWQRSNIDGNYMTKSLLIYSDKESKKGNMEARILLPSRIASIHPKFIKENFHGLHINQIVLPAQGQPSYSLKFMRS